MSSSLSKIVDYLSEFSSKKCGDKTCESECEFKGDTNNKLFYRCSECKKKTVKTNKWINQKVSNYTQIL